MISTKAFSVAGTIEAALGKVAAGSLGITLDHSLKEKRREEREGRKKKRGKGRGSIENENNH
jgi:hypothetical protein